jgi:hypothetical protein
VPARASSPWPGSALECPGASAPLAALRSDLYGNALANQVLTGLYPVLAREQNELVRVVATRIEWDGTMQRRMVDTAYRSGEPQWEDLAARALAVSPPYHPVPGAPIYHVSLDDGTVVLVAEHDLCGPLLDLVTAVLAIGEAV